MCHAPLAIRCAQGPGSALLAYVSTALRQDAGLQSGCNGRTPSGAPVPGKRSSFQHGGTGHAGVRTNGAETWGRNSRTNPGGPKRSMSSHACVTLPCLRRPTVPGNAPPCMAPPHFPTARTWRQSPLAQGVPHVLPAFRHLFPIRQPRAVLCATTTPGTYPRHSPIPPTQDAPARAGASVCSWCAAGWRRAG